MRSIWAALGAAAILIGLFFSAKYLARDENPPPNLESPAVTDACSLLNGSAFRSIAKLEIGEGPNGGAVLGTWSIGFRGNQFTWDYSDVQQSGTYTCTDGSIIAQAYKRTIEGRIDAERKILTWDGIEYRKVE